MQAKPIDAPRAAEPPDCMHFHAQTGSQERDGIHQWQEVVVQFLDGNIGHPIVVGIVYNRAYMPPWHLPAQRVLADLRSREPGGGGSNHPILDDTGGAMQVQLKSDHGRIHLSLGSITRIETSDGRGEGG